MMTLDEFVTSLFHEAMDADAVFRSVHSPGRSICRHLVSQIQDKLINQGEHVVLDLPDVTSAAEDLAFKLQGSMWVDHLKAKVCKVPEKQRVWVLLVPKDPAPSPALDSVPIKYCFTLWNGFYRYLPQRLLDKYGVKDRYAHAIVADPFFINSHRHKADLWYADDLAKITHGFAWPEVVEQDRWLEAIHVKGLAEELRDQYGMDRYAAYARALLLKEHFGMAGQHGITKSNFRYLEKRGDMLLVDIETEPEHAPLWCKFGSPRMLHLEHVNTSRLRRVPSLRQFLYVTKNNPLRDALRADYIGLLVSEHETGEGNAVPQTLEGFYHARTQGDADAEITSVLSRLDKFLGVLHAGQRWAKSTAEKYNVLLTSRRANWEDNKNESPVQRARPGQGAYEIEYIRPRDGSPPDPKSDRRHDGRPPNPRADKVVMYLKPLDANTIKQQILLSWTSPEWRWRCWREGLVEGAGVDLRRSLTISDAGDRIGHHLTNYRSVLRLKGTDPDLKERFQRLSDELTSYLNVEIEQRQGAKEDSEIVLRGDCSVKQLMPFDLYPHYLHGDLHPRNVLVFEPRLTKPAKGRKRIDIKIIDLAQAVVGESKQAPMAYDFAVLEVDAKARMVLDAHFQYALETNAPTTNDPNTALNLLADLDREEAALWRWCRDAMPNCFDDSWKILGKKRGKGTKRSEMEPLNSPRGRFGFVGAWRSRALARLRLGVVNAQVVRNLRDAIKESDWAPARSYAQALFLSSIAYLKLLDPDNGNETMRGYACIVGASHALDVLQEAKKL